jgi:hypothetical protein
MKKAVCITAMLGIVMLPCAIFAQTTPAQSPVAPEAASAAAAIPADQQPTKEQLSKLFEVMRLREQMQNVMKAVPAMVQQQIKAQTDELLAKVPGGKPLTTEQQAAMDKIMNKYMQQAMNIYPADELISDMSVVYMHHLRAADVDAFIAFYSSVAGQHLLDAQPAIMQEYMPMVMNRMKERSKALTDDLMKDMTEFAESATPSADKPAAK